MHEFLIELGESVGNLLEFHFSKGEQREEEERRGEGLGLDGLSLALAENLINCLSQGLLFNANAIPNANSSENANKVGVESVWKSLLLGMANATTSERNGLSLWKLLEISSKRGVGLSLEIWQTHLDIVAGAWNVDDHDRLLLLFQIALVKQGLRQLVEVFLLDSIPLLLPFHYSPDSPLKKLETRMQIIDLLRSMDGLVLDLGIPEVTRKFERNGPFDKVPETLGNFGFHLLSGGQQALEGLSSASSSILSNTQAAVLQQVQAIHTSFHKGSNQLEGGKDNSTNTTTNTTSNSSSNNNDEDTLISSHPANTHAMSEVLKEQQRKIEEISREKMGFQLEIVSLRREREVTAMELSRLVRLLEEHGIDSRPAESPLLSSLKSTEGGGRHFRRRSSLLLQSQSIAQAQIDELTK